MREVTLLINDRASSSIERWRARHYSSCAFPRPRFLYLSLLCLYHSTSTFYTHTQAHTKHSLFLTPFKKKVIISLTPSLTTLFIINVNVLRNRKKPYSVQTSKMVSSLYILLPLLDLFHLGLYFFLARIHIRMSC